MVLVTLDDIRAAALRVAGVARRTPLLDITVNGGRRGGPSGPPATLALKCESLQPMGAFKIRGACNMIAQLPAGARAAGVIT